MLTDLCVRAAAPSLPFHQTNLAQQDTAQLLTEHYAAKLRDMAGVIGQWWLGRGHSCVGLVATAAVLILLLLLMVWVFGGGKMGP